MTANSVVNQIFQSESFVLQKSLNCPKSTIQGVGTDGLSLYKTHGSRRWYTRRPFPVPNPRFNAVGTPESLFLYQIHDPMQLVHQKAFPCTKPTIQCSWYTRRPFPVPNPRFNAVGTPESLFLYQIHDSRRLVHQTAFPCTNSTTQCSWYRRPFPVQNPRFKAWYTRRPFPVPTPIIKLSKR